MKKVKFLRNLGIIVMVVAMIMPSISVSAASNKYDAVNFTPNQYSTVYYTDKLSESEAACYENVEAYATFGEIYNYFATMIKNAAVRQGKATYVRSISNIQDANELSAFAYDNAGFLYDNGALIVRNGRGNWDDYPSRLDLSKMLTFLGENKITLYGIRNATYIKDVKYSPYPSYVYQCGLLNLSPTHKFNPYGKVKKADLHIIGKRIVNNNGYGIISQDEQKAFEMTFKVKFTSQSSNNVVTETQNLIVGDTRDIYFNSNTDYNFSVENSYVADIQYTSTNGNSEYARIVAKNPGSTTINITLNGVVVKKVNITVSPNNIYTISIPDTKIKVGTVVKIQPTINSNQNVSLAWSSSVPSVANVDSYGNVTAYNVGYTTITVKTSNNITATCVVTVYANSIWFQYSSYEATVNTEFYIPVNMNPQNQYVYWESSNSNVLSVDTSSGKIKALSTGTAYITASLYDGTTKASCLVIVKASKVLFNSTSKEIKVGSSYNVISDISGNLNGQNYYFWSDDSSIAYVDASNGWVIGKKEGITYIHLSINGYETSKLRVLVLNP